MAKGSDSDGQSRYDAMMQELPDGLDLTGADSVFGRVLNNSAVGIARITVDPPIPIDLPVDEQVRHGYEHGVTIEWNSTFATQYGYDSDTDMRALSLQQVVPLSDERNKKFMRHLIENDYSATREETFERDKEGNVKVFLNTIYGKKQGRYVGDFWLSMIDITTLKLTQLSLQRSEEKYAKAFQSSPDAIVITRLADSCIVEVNCGFELMTGYDRESVIGEKTLDLGLWWNAQDRDDYIHLLEKDGHARDMEVAFRAKSGERIVCLTSAESIVLHGEQCILSTTRDITQIKSAEEERRRLEAQLRQAQKMEVMGQLTSGIVHDFNNILSSVIGYSELAAENSVVKSDHKVNGYLTEVQRAGQRARSLVNQMLVFSRCSTDTARNIDASELVSSVTRMMRPTLPATIEVSKELQPGVICIDPVQFEQALINLCINARDSMRNGGRLSLVMSQGSGPSTQCAVCGEGVGSDSVAISVTDSGDGIPAEAMPQLFQPFFSTKAVGEGTGMGLAMVDNIVHAHDGHLLVNSRAGEGTTFTMLFPATTIDAEGPQTVSPDFNFDAANDRQAHVLVVDDEQSVGTLMGRLLESRGYAATVLDNSESALQYFKQNVSSVDVVVTDHTMPRMTGLQLSQRLLELRPDLPIILCSGYSTEVNKSAAVKLGIRGYQNKPIDIDEFFKQLHDVIPDAA